MVSNSFCAGRFLLFRTIALAQVKMCVRSLLSCFNFQHRKIEDTHTHTQKQSDFAANDHVLALTLGGRFLQKYHHFSEKRNSNRRNQTAKMKNCIHRAHKYTHTDDVPVMKRCIKTYKYD